MVEPVVVRPDQVSLGVLISAVSREVVDVAVAVCGFGRNARMASCPRT